jgi:hypothetical protein
MYFGHGFTFSDILELTEKERAWFMKRLLRQLRTEAKKRT